MNQKEPLKTFAFIESNTTGSGMEFIKIALLEGYTVLFLTSDPFRYPLLSQFDIELVEIDTTDYRKLTTELRRREDIIGIFSSSEYFIETAARVASQLGLRGNSVKAINDCRHKERLYFLLESKGFSVPKTQFIQENIECNPIIDFPIIVKPSNGSGSFGVKLCQNLSSFRVQKDKIFSEPNERGEGNQGVLMQEYVPGFEYSAEVIITEDQCILIGITKKHVQPGENFIEYGHDFPLSLEPSKLKTLTDTIEGALKAVGYSFGPAHIEFKWVKGKVTFIEINPRLAGGMIPQLIQLATGQNIYAIILNLYAGKKVDFTFIHNRGASIRFFVANHEGIIKQMATLRNFRGVKDLKTIVFTKAVGDEINLHHDFRDRIGYVIVEGKNSQASRKKADRALEKFFIQIDPKEKSSSKEIQHSLLKKLMSEEVSVEDKIKELENISKIDLAHILMLCANGVIDEAKGKELLQEIMVFRNAIKEKVCALDFSRGTYIAYENFLKERLGRSFAGMSHLARSRNDINATIAKLKFRVAFSKIYEKLEGFLEVLLNTAELHLETPLPIYSQFQAAVPGSYGFYLIAIANCLFRVMEDLHHIEPELNIMPLGSGTGSGTNIQIDPSFIASMLGFKTFYQNALDAISHRDFSLRFKNILSLIAVELSRVAQDFQLWSTREFALFDLPQAICGASSMMPQKKNPYLLEVIKSRSGDVLAELNLTYMKMYKVPTGNSIEVSHAEKNELDNIVLKMIEALDLIGLVIDSAIPSIANIEKSNQAGFTVSTMLANQLVQKEKIPFREAYEKIKETLNSASIDWNDASIHFSAQAYGGGPSIENCTKEIKNGRKKMIHSKAWSGQLSLFWQEAELSLMEKVKQFISKKVPSTSQHETSCQIYSIRNSEEND